MTSVRSSRQSIAPGTLLDISQQEHQIIFNLISENNHRRLESYLDEKKEAVNLLEIQEQREYTALCFAAFKHHTHCFKIIYNHGVRYNIPNGATPDMKLKYLKNWADTPTDEHFTALHFATYHGN